MARIPYTPHPPKASSSRCCACGQGRGDVRQALIGRLPQGLVWLCGDCAEREANRQAFLAAYVARASAQVVGWHGEPTGNQLIEED